MDKATWRGLVRMRREGNKRQEDVLSYRVARDWKRSWIGIQRRVIGNGQERGRMKERWGGWDGLTLSRGRGQGLEAQSDSRPRTNPLISLPPIPYLSVCPHLQPHTHSR